MSLYGKLTVADSSTFRRGDVITICGTSTNLERLVVSVDGDTMVIREIRRVDRIWFFVRRLFRRLKKWIRR